MIIGKLRNYLGEFRMYNKEHKQVLNALERKNEILMARIIRFVHSIEKGLSIESPRSEFGYEKIKTLYGYINEYIKIKDIDKTCIYMAADALDAYLEYHKSIGVDSPKIQEVAQIALELKEIKEKDNVKGVYGGVKTINKSEMAFESDFVENLFKTRHSIRQFSTEPVPDSLIEKAVELAQNAPSACNRQAVRTYAMNSKKFIKNYPSNLQGVGGFIEACDKVILITGKISAYEEYEYKQFVVTAGIFAGYLSLALHGLGLGACVVQRSIRPNNEWHEFCNKNNIPTDEQLICLVTVGKMNKTTVVPFSNRLSTDTILKWL